MAITRPVPNANKVPAAGGDAAAEAFISGAPDAPKKPRGVIKGKRQQITLTMSSALTESEIQHMMLRSDGIAPVPQQT